MGASEAFDGEGVYFIAEAGVNHNGSLARAKEMVDTAETAGADAVKFQAYVAEASVTPSEEKAKYQKENTEEEESQLEMLQRYELTRSDHAELQSYCKEKGVDFITTISTLESIDKIKGLDIEILKFGSPDINNYPSLECAANLDTPLIISTGMSHIEEVDAAVEHVRKHNQDIELALLHCVSDYPADPRELNLRAIRTMRERYSLPIGFSDHTTHPETPSIAVGFGATIIEKHFTLDRSLPGPDHSASLNPEELRNAVQSARRASKMRGDGEKKPTPSEQKNRPKIRRSVHSTSDIKSGAVISEANVRICRPADGLPPACYEDVIGATASVDISAGQPITEDVVDI